MYRYGPRPRRPYRSPIDEAVIPPDVIRPARSRALPMMDKAPGRARCLSRRSFSEGGSSRAVSSCLSMRPDTMLERASNREVNSIDILIWLSVERIADVKTDRSDRGDVLESEAGA